MSPKAATVAPAQRRVGRRNRQRSAIFHSPPQCTNGEGYFLLLLFSASSVQLGVATFGRRWAVPGSALSAMIRPSAKCMRLLFLGPATGPTFEHGLETEARVV